MSTARSDIDFNSVESFHLLLKNLWSADLAFRLRLNVVDTILFRDGVPHYWIFTSDQTGVSFNSIPWDRLIISF